MHREHIIELLNAYEIAHPEEQQTVSQFRTFATSYVDCFKRKCIPGHITASAWLLNQEGTHVLLTHHRKLDRWFQLGGHVDGECDVLIAAKRELEEESGLSEFRVVTESLFDLDIHMIPERHSELEHYHYDMRFLFQVTGSDAYTVSDESHDLAWVVLDNLSAYTTEATMARMAEKSLKNSKS